MQVIRLVEARAKVQRRTGEPVGVAQARRVPLGGPGRLFWSLVGAACAVGSVSRAHAQAWQYQPASGFTGGQVYSMCEWDPDGPGGAPKKIVVIGSFADSTSGVTGLNGVAAWNGSDWERLGAGIGSNALASGINESEVIAFDFDGPGPMGASVVVRSSASFSVEGQASGFAAVWDGSGWQRLDVGTTGHRCLVVHDLDGSGPLPPRLFAGGAGVWRLNLGQPAERVGTNQMLRMTSFDADGPGPQVPVLIASAWAWGGGMYRWDGTDWTSLAFPYNSWYVQDLVPIDLDGSGPQPTKIAVGCQLWEFGPMGMLSWDPQAGSFEPLPIAIPGNNGYSGSHIGLVDLDANGPQHPTVYTSVIVNPAWNDQHCLLVALDGDTSVVTATPTAGVYLWGGWGQPVGPRHMIVSDLDDNPATPPEMFVSGLVTYSPPGQPTTSGVIRRTKNAEVPLITWTFAHEANHTCYLGQPCGVGHSWISNPSPLPAGGSGSDSLNFVLDALQWNFDMQFDWGPGRFGWRSYDAQLRHGSWFQGWLTPHIQLTATAWSSALPGTRHTRTERATAFVSGTGEPSYGSVGATYNNRGLAGVSTGADSGTFTESITTRSYRSTALELAPGVVWTQLGSFTIDLGGFQNLSFPPNVDRWLGQWNADGEMTVAIAEGARPTGTINGAGSAPGSIGSLTFTATAQDTDGAGPGINGYGVAYYEWTLDGTRVAGGRTAVSHTVDFTDSGAHRLALRVYDDEGQQRLTERVVGLCDGPPVIAESPSSQMFCLMELIHTNLRVGIQMSQPADFQWEWRPTALAAWRDVVEGTNAEGVDESLQFQATGAAGSDLEIGAVRGLGSGERAWAVRCVLTNACGSVTTGVAVLSMCDSDFNCDGGIDGVDIEAFFASWESGDPSADVNQDGGIDGADVSTFFAAWEAGGCG